MNYEDKFYDDSPCALDYDVEPEKYSLDSIELERYLDTKERVLDLKAEGYPCL